MRRCQPPNWVVSIGLWVSLWGLVRSLPADDWPQWRGTGRDGVWNEGPLLEQFPAGGLPPRWSVPIGAGYSGPTVAEGRVFVTDRQTDPEQRERILCVDATTGKELWTHAYASPYTISYQAGPRAAVTVHEGRAYALGAMGHLHCLRAADGKVEWQRDLANEFQIEMPIWGIAAAPLVHSDLVILHIGGAEGACVIGLGARDGQLRWKALDDRAGYSAPILVRQAGKDVVVVWTGDSVSGLDPLSGHVYWRREFPPKNMPIGVATPIVQGDRLFVTSFYDGSLMLRLPSERLEVETLWHRVGADEQHTDALQSIISTPIWIGDHIYGVDSYGELRCLDVDRGDRVWEDLTATPKARWSTIHFVRNRDRVWMFNERGELIIAQLDPRGFHEISRTKIIEPTQEQLRQRNGVCWAHPAFAGRCIFVRNDRQLICVDLSQ